MAAAHIIDPVAAKASGQVMRWDYIPWAVYSLPEAAGVGLTQAQASERYRDVVTATVPLVLSGRIVAENGLKSLYDLHRDGSGIVYGTLRRPIIDFRPDARCRTFDAPHQFAADLYLVDWLTTSGTLRSRRENRATEEIHAIALAAWRSRMEGVGSGQAIAELAAAVVDGTTDPYTAADQLMGALS